MSRRRTDAALTEPRRPDWLARTVWPFEIQTITTGEQTTSYTDTGTGPTLLFVHAGMWSILWRDVIALLQERYRCVTLDVPGNGLSTNPAGPLTFQNAADAIDTLVRNLELVDITVVVHDLGGVAALEAASRWPERVTGIVAINTFGWRPSGPMFQGMLAVMGSTVIRELDGLTAWLPRAASTRFGVGRNWDRQTRKTFRRGMSRDRRKNFHRYMAAARRHDYNNIDATLKRLADRPLMTIFGQHNDPLRFQPKWKALFSNAEQIVIAKGLHFPMCDAPETVAAAIASWHTTRVILAET